jgi:hypothetical protein
MLFEILALRAKISNKINDEVAERTQAGYPLGASQAQATA